MMECTAENEDSHWHNFKTDETHWTVKFGNTAENRTLCVNEDGFIQAANQGQPWQQFIKDIRNNGALKIWSNIQTGKDVPVTLTGGPDFTA